MVPHSFLVLFCF